MRIFIVATFPSLRNRADELLQEFAEDKILKDGWLKRANRNRGRFRDFLKSSLRNFVLDRLRRDRTQPDSLDNLQCELPAPEEPSSQFDLMWTRTVLAEALRKMEADCKDPDAEQPRRTHIWDMFRIRILDPIFNDSLPVPYDQLIERFELRSPTEASNMLLSAKRIFKTHLERVIAAYAGANRATAEEIKALSSFLQGLEKRG
jgi:hypothetical protein